MGQIEPFKSKQKFILPEGYVDSLVSAINDIESVLDDEEAHITLIREVVSFRRRNHFTQSELGLALNIGWGTGRSLEKFERMQLKSKADTLLILKALREFAESTTTFVSWVNINSEDLSFHVDQVRDSLVEVLSALSNLNENPNNKIFATELVKTQLIAILKAAIAELEAPKVDRGRMAQVVGGLAKLSSTAAKKGASKIAERALNEAVNKGVKLLDKLSELPGSDSFT